MKNVPLLKKKSSLYNMSFLQRKKKNPSNMGCQSP